MEKPGISGQLARKSALIVLWLLALLIAAISARYFLPGMPGGFTEQADSFLEQAFVLRLHLAAGIIAVLLAPLQLWSPLRAARPRLHRLSGRLYVTVVVISALASFALAPNSHGGIVSHIGFGLLGIFWLGFTLAGWRLAVRGNYVAHRRFMVRSAALCFAFISLRLWLPLLTGLGMDFTAAYLAVSFLAWVPNLLIAEIYLRKQNSLSLRLR